MSRSKLTFNLLSFALLAAGFLLSFWPFGLLGLLVAAAAGQYAAAVIIGLVLDVAYGAPLGTLHFLHVPFTLLAFAASISHYFLSAYVRRGDSGRL